MESSPDDHTSEISLSIADVQNAAEEGIITESASQDLIRWACERAAAEGRNKIETVPSETAKGFNVVTVAYYFGAMLMISACAWFLGDKWDALGTSGVLTTTIIYFGTAVSLGWWLRGRNYIVGGGLLITVAVCLVPLITFCIEKLTGIWPDMPPGKYEDFYPLVRGSWIAMEMATMAVALIALRSVRFGFLTAPLAFSLWFFSMDLGSWILGRNSLEWNERAWISVAVGFVTMFVGYGLDRTLNSPDKPRSEDFAFWCYLFGLMGFWGGLTSIDSDSEIGRFVYLLVNIGLVGIALYLRRTVFLVFGAIGIHIYLGHLAYEVFKDSFLFPFALALLGLSLILVTVFTQSYLRKSAKISAP